MANPQQPNQEREPQQAQPGRNPDERGGQDVEPKGGQERQREDDKTDQQRPQ